MLIKTNPMRLLLIVFSIGTTLSLAAQNFTGLDTAIERITKNTPFVGATILVAKGDTILHNKGYGFAHREFKVPATDSTRYWVIGNKNLTLASIAMQLVDQGKFSLDDKISKYLKNIPPSWEPITIKHLITCTSGLQDYHYLGDRYDALNGLSLAQDEVMYRFMDKPLTMTPGSKFDWSISNFVILNRIMETTSGKTYQQLLNEFIAPLGISSTACFERGTTVKNMAQGYEFNYATMQYFPSTPSVFQYEPSGFLYSTPQDLFMIWRGMVNGKLISRKSYELMISKEEMQKNNSAPFVYLASYATVGKDEMLVMNGALPGFSGTWHYIPKLDATVIVLTNSSGDIGQDASRLSRQVIQYLLGMPPERVRQLPPPPPLDNEMISMDEMNQVSGVYYLKMDIQTPGNAPGSYGMYRKTMRVFSDHNRLMIQELGKAPVVLLKQKSGSYRIADDLYAVISFKFINEQGKTPQLIMNKLGMKLIGERVGDADVKTFHEGLIK